MRVYLLTAWLMVLLVAAVSACSSETRLRVSITGSDAVQFDTWQLRVQNRVATADALSALDVLLPDDMAGDEVRVELWALDAGTQVAYGNALVIPSLHGTVEVLVTVGAVACGAWCQPGSITCASEGAVDGTRECVQAANGCLQYSALTACPTGTPYCSNGGCSDTCSNECTDGETACDGSVAVRSCGQHDTDPCLDLSPAMSCGANETCTNGMCSTSQTCMSGDDCDDSDMCTDNDTCTNGMCSGAPRSCTDLAPACTSATMLRLYGATGSCNSNTGACSNTYNDALCKRGCANDACNPTLTAGGDNGCAIKANGTLQCWGAMLSSTLPTGTFKAISVKHYHGCGTTTAGGTACWRRQPFDNFNGEVDVPTGSTFTAVSAGDGFSCGILTNGSLDCWGDMTNSQSTPPNGTFVSLSCGIDHSCAIRTDGTAACWGKNNDGQTTALDGKFTQVAAGARFSCGLRTDGTIECWGLIATPTPGSYASLSAGFDHACGVRKDGQVKCWGSNTNSKSTPPPGTYTSVACGNEHTCAVRASDGTIACWGDNSNGATSVPAGL